MSKPALSEESMRIQIIGTGIVGEATAYLAKSFGHEVYGYDINPRQSPYYTNISSTGKTYDLTFVCVNETLVDGVLSELVGKGILNIVIRSTTRPGTTKALSEKYKVSLCHNPEFLREKTYLADALTPPFVLIGTTDIPYKSLCGFYRPLQDRCKLIYTDVTTSEMAKLTLNNYLATLITFWNQINEVCKTVGVDTESVARVISNDSRVSSYGFTPCGEGFGGKCLPKDLVQLIDYGKSVGCNMSVMESIGIFNTRIRGLRPV